MSVPLIAAGEITPEILIAIGQVAKKYTKALFLLFLCYHL
jgi:NAD(P)H-nitrite reductase large subunit